jgi:hypothetical protein
MGWGDQFLRARAWTFGVLFGVLFVGAPGCRYEPSTSSFVDDSAESIQDGSSESPGGVMGDGGLYHSLARIYGVGTDACYSALLALDLPGAVSRPNVSAAIRVSCPGISPYYVPALGDPRQFPLASGWSVVLVRVDPVSFARVRFVGDEVRGATSFPMFVLFIFPQSDVNTHIRRILDPLGVSEKANRERYDYSISCPAVSGVFNPEARPDPACLVTPAREILTPPDEGNEVTLQGKSGRSSDPPKPPTRK